jgi:hypothetical protein
MLVFFGTLLFLLLAAIAATGMVMLYLTWRKEQNVQEIVAATSEWRPTDKIDFHCAETPQDEKVPATFVLQVEDYRTVETISGVQRVEIRWRNATLAEAKSVVAAHQSVTETGMKGYQIPRQLKSLRPVELETQAAG